jgi:hypothetical protein
MNTSIPGFPYLGRCVRRFGRYRRPAPMTSILVSSITKISATWHSSVVNLSREFSPPWNSLFSAQSQSARASFHSRHGALTMPRRGDKNFVARGMSVSDRTRAKYFALMSMSLTHRSTRINLKSRFLSRVFCWTLPPCHLCSPTGVPNFGGQCALSRGAWVNKLDASCRFTQPTFP